MSDQTRSFYEPLMALFKDGIRYSSVIDIGCADAGFFLWGHSAGWFKSAKPFLFDLNPIYKPSFEMIKKKLGGDFRITAVSDVDGKLPVILADNPMWSSARGEDNIYWKRIGGVSGQKSSVPCRSLDSLSIELNFTPPFFLKLDVQGSELSVLKGALNVLKDTSAVLCECDIDDFASINNFFSDNNFHLFDINTMNFVEGDKLGWFYAVYVSNSISHVLPKGFIREDSVSAVSEIHKERSRMIIDENTKYLNQFSTDPDYIVSQINENKNTSNRPNAIEIRLKQSYSVACVPSLKSMTTFTLLEQERWFEKEIDFVDMYIKPGMKAIDIGSNVGVYTLLCAKNCGEIGHVYAYDPNPEMTSLLHRSVISNGFKNVTISEVGVSDKKGESQLILGSVSEFGKIGSDDTGKKITLTSLDEELKKFGWDRIDFLKIDAEGVEEQIIIGGELFFSKITPIVMIEVLAESGRNLGPIKRLEKFDYFFFRQLGRLPVLVPADLDGLDGFELNLFAVPRSKICALVEAQILVMTINDWTETAEDLKHAQKFWQSKWYISSMPLEAQVFKHPQYTRALIAYAYWADETGDLSRRIDALHFALMTLRDLCQTAPTKARMVSLSRVEFEFGNRSKAFDRLKDAWYGLEDSTLDEVFCPPSEASETFEGKPSFDDWLWLACHEQVEYISCLLTFIWRMRPEPVNNYRILESSPYRSLRTARARVLLDLVNGQPLQIPDDLKVASKYHLNPEYWNETLLSMV